MEYWFITILFEIREAINVTIVSSATVFETVTVLRPRRVP